MEKVQSRAVTPPPQPREHQGRLSALSSREQRLSQALSELHPLHTYTDYPALLSRVHETLTEHQPLLLPTEPIGNQTLSAVLYAGQNSIRREDLQQIIQESVHENIPVMRLSAVDEAHDPDVFIAAQSKIISAETQIMQARRDGSGEMQSLRKALTSDSLLIISNDELNLVPRVKEDEKTGEPWIDVKGLGKPENPEQVRGNFERLSKDAEENGWRDITYIIRNITYIRNPSPTYPNRDAYSLRHAVVHLNIDVIKYLATDEGFQKYRDVVKKYAGNNREVHEIAGGFELKALEEMGAIERISRDASYQPEHLSPEEKKALFAYAYSLALGKSDKEFIHEYTAQFNKHPDVPSSSLPN